MLGTVSSPRAVTAPSTLTIAPKLCPISCVTTSHSVGPKVETAVPETMLGAEPDAVCWHLHHTGAQLLA